MISYRDRSFCISRDCGNTECERRLTDDVFEKASAFGLCVSLVDETKSCNCYIEKTEL